MGEHSEVFVAFDTAKLRRAVAIAQIVFRTPSRPSRMLSSDCTGSSPTCAARRPWSIGVGVRPVFPASGLPRWRVEVVARRPDRVDRPHTGNPTNHLNHL